MNELALFAGAGGGILGGVLCGFRCICAVEIDPYCRAVLAARQNDGSLPPFPIWDDVCTFRGDEWRGRVDVVSGGFPCQDISIAGRGAGIDGAKSGLWREMARIIGEVGPRYVIVENSPALLVRGFDTVLGDLASMGFDARWGVLGARHAGAPHDRERVWIVATHPHRVGESQPQGADRNERRWTLDRRQEAPDPQGIGCDAGGLPQRTSAEFSRACLGGWWAAEPDVVRMVHGLAFRLDRIKALGNGQVPAVVRLAWDLLKPKNTR